MNPKPFVIPELRDWKGSEGSFTPSTDTRIVYSPKSPGLKRIAELFANDYNTMFGQTLEVVAGKAKVGDFEFILRADKALGKEGYAVKVTDRVQLSAPEEIRRVRQPIDRVP